MPFRVLLLVTVLLHGCTPEPRDPRRTAAPDSAQDVAAIRALHEADMAAVLAGDADALLGLWSSDPLALPPDGPILAGFSDISTLVAPLRTRDGRPWKMVESVQDFREIQVVGDHAWDLGTVRTRMVHEDGRELVQEARLLRILRRAPDGSWRVHRSAWSNGEPVVSRPGG